MMRIRPLLTGIAILVAWSAGAAIVHHGITGEWGLAWDDFLFWRRSHGGADGSAVRNWSFHTAAVPHVVVDATDADVQFTVGNSDSVSVEIWLTGQAADIDAYKT